jgi:hypothetical protein
MRTGGAAIRMARRDMVIDTAARTMSHGIWEFTVTTHKHAQPKIKSGRATPRIHDEFTPTRKQQFLEMRHMQDVLAGR